MTKPAENPERTPKKTGLGKILYFIAVALLLVALLVSVWMFLQEKLSRQTAGEETAQTTLKPQPTQPVPTLPEQSPTVPDVPEGPDVPEEPDAPEEPNVPELPDQQVQPTKPDIRLKAYQAPVSLLSQAARDYLAAENVRDVTEFVSRYWEIESRSDLGRPVELTYTVYALPKGVTVENAVFRLFENNGGYTQYTPGDGGRSVFIYNLRTGTEYRYSVSITLSDGTKLTLPGSFKTAVGPRLMHIDGLVNVRDLGGWVTADGKTVKQGLLYRGSEMDGLVEKDFKLTDQGLEQMKALGIKTDFDLRHEGADVLEGEHHFYDAIQYEHAFTDEGQEAVRKLFTDLADPAHYPAYLHCTYGADRTGTMCYLLLGLLGVSDADLKRDYELTALYYGYVSPAQMDAFVAKIAALPGENTREKVEHFLASAGVTADQMEQIRQIFLG